MDRMMQPIKDYLFADQHNYQGYVDPAFSVTLPVSLAVCRMHVPNRVVRHWWYIFRDKKVVDIYTGKKSVTENWQPDTMSLCYSTGKGVLATLAHILVSQGYLDYDQTGCRILA